MPKSFETHEDILNGFRALTAPGTGFMEHVTNTEVNLIYVRIRNYLGEDRFFSMVINRVMTTLPCYFLGHTATRGLKPRG